ncbi:MAG: hypothetical protein LBG97_05860 [Coriobacteriales bacterium]|jgi:regulator of replication initiation timing|nr:hypothetical protein [Coriobacteriales bacterium]
MIYKGRYQNLYLYEVTEQDLILKGEAMQEYSVGNVLVFSDRKNIQFGSQLIRADDMESALEFFQSDPDYSSIMQDVASEDMQDEQFTSNTAEQSFNNRTLNDLSLTKLSNDDPPSDDLESINAHLRSEIEKRDELLRDISENLNIQRDHNEALKSALLEAQERLTVNDITQEEMLSDLENISAETQTIELTLERTLEEKSQLEAELAKSIAEFIELNFQNDDLRRRLDELNSKVEANSSSTTPSASPTATPSATSTTAPTQTPASALNSIPTSTSVPASAPTATTASTPAHPFINTRQGSMYTLPSGKNIQVYHEFPRPTRRSGTATFALGVRTIIRTFALILLGILVVIAVSVFATAQVNHTSLGDALNALLALLG